MKRTLLTSALAIMGFATATAQVFDHFTGNKYHVMSDDGVYVAEANSGELSVRNRLTNAQYFVHHVNETDPISITGKGHCISAKGTLVGTDGVNACYWVRGGLKIDLPKPSYAGTTMASGSSITDDDKYIAGTLATTVAFGADGLMSFPVLWTKQANGTYAYEEVPFPRKDFTGRDPQFVRINEISADGSVMVGVVMDYTGFRNYPIIWKKATDGTWTYKTIGANILWDTNKVKDILPMPVDPSSSCPQDSLYLSQNDKDTYNAAADAYRDAYDQYQAGLIPFDSVPPYPYIFQYITDRRDEWVADSAAYMAKVDQFYKDFAAYDQSLKAVLLPNNFLFNDVQLSRNGRYFAASLSISQANDNAIIGKVSEGTTPIIFDLEESDSLPDRVFSQLTDHYTSSVTNDGTLIVASPLQDTVRNSYVIRPGETEATPFLDYITARSAEAGAFIKKNYTFTVVTGDDDDDPGTGGGGNPGWGDGGDGDLGGGGVVASMGKISTNAYVTHPDSTVTGTVYCNGDGTIFGSYMQEYFTDVTYGNTIDRSYVIDLREGATSGIHNAAATEAADAPVLRTEYYDVNGQRIYRAPENGVFIEKKITANGAVTVKRVK